MQIVICKSNAVFARVTALDDHRGWSLLEYTYEIPRCTPSIHWFDVTLVLKAMNLEINVHQEPTTKTHGQDMSSTKKVNVDKRVWFGRESVGKAC